MAYLSQDVIHIAGPGGAGKDAAAEIISELTGTPYLYSTSYAASRPFFTSIEDGDWVAAGLPPGKYSNSDALYADRASHRMTWVAFIDEFNKPDGVGLYRSCIEQGNRVLTGIRRRSEMRACLAVGLIDLNIWLCDSGISPAWHLDDSLEYGPELCDVIIVNEHLADHREGIRLLREKLTRLFRPWGRTY